MLSKIFHRHPWRSILSVMCIVVMLSGCTISAAMPIATTTPVPTNTPVPTSTPVPTNTPAPVAGVCRAADFLPSQLTHGGTHNGAPDNEFQFPPLTYYYDFGPAAGTHFYDVCSSGDPTSILAFMRQAIAASPWKITSANDTTLAAEKPVSPPNGYCYTLNVTVGGFPGYLGEWTFALFAPATMCA